MDLNNKTKKIYDANGKEVSEGDVLTAGESVYIVVEEDGRKLLKLGPSMYTDALQITKTLKVIGNVNQDPNLIKNL